MLIGNGLIANTFRFYENNNDVIIFASGVSNSKETDDFKFERELNLLKQILIFKDLKKLIYFSTCSILDDSLINSKYVNHKKKIEEFIKINFKNYIIFRIPNVISYSNNHHTSFNFFKNKIINGDEIECQTYATRYFIGINDLKKTIPFFIDSKIFNNQTINVCFNNKILIKKFIIKIGKILKIKPLLKLKNEGSDYTIDNSIFMGELLKRNYKINKNYNYNVIKQYII